MPLWYLLAGCPVLVANLWDVTDRDIDKFTLALLDEWLPESARARGERRALGDAVAAARGAVKLKFLNGCAPVCWGVPTDAADAPVEEL